MKNILIFIYLICLFIYPSKFSYAKEGASLSGRYKDYNVILIILDALRPDYLNCYRHGKETSPNLDRLARQGVIFTNAFSQSHNTLPSVASIFTSLYPYSHGAQHVFKDSLPDNIFTLADILNSYGYKTAWFGVIKDPHTGASKNLLKGFQQRSNLDNNYAQVFSLIEKLRDERFFITVHSYVTHELYLFLNQSGYTGDKKSLPESLKKLCAKSWEETYKLCKSNPEELDKIFGKGWSKKNVKYFALPYSQEGFDKISATLDSDTKKFLLIKRIKFDPTYAFLTRLGPEGLAELLSFLEGAIYELDRDLIGGLIRSLKENNLYDKTIVIITADHGNEYREHGDIGHGTFLFDEIIRVPLLFRIPFLKQGVKLNSLVQSIDILPTVLELLNIPVPHYAQGISLLGQIEGKPGSPMNDYIFAQTVPGSLAIRSKHYKLILHNAGNGPFYELYNLKNDPLEKNNLAGYKLKIADVLMVDLNSKFFSLPEYQRKNSKFLSEIDLETREKIRQTGYW